MRKILHTLIAAGMRDNRRQIAALLGEEFYQGRPCNYGHPGKRITKYNGQCWHCYQAAKVGYTGEDARRPQYADIRKKMFNQAKHRAAKSGIPFEIAHTDIVIPECCPISGEPMDTPSLDRVDNSKGYTKDNIAVISWRMNRLKSSGSIKDFENILKFMRGHSLLQ